MSKAKVRIKSETETGEFELTVSIPQEHELFRQILDYGISQAAPDDSQLPLPLAAPGVCATTGCGKPAGLGAYCERCVKAITEIEEVAAIEADQADQADQAESPAPPSRPADPPPPICDADGCENPATKATGFCRACNKKQRAADADANNADEQPDTEPPPTVCDHPGCDEPREQGRAYCGHHQRQAAAAAAEIGCEAPGADGLVYCKVSGCRRGASMAGLCHLHRCATDGCPNISTSTGLCADCMSATENTRPAARAPKTGDRA